MHKKAHLNAYADVSREASSKYSYNLRLHRYPYSEYASSEDKDETARI